MTLFKPITNKTVVPYRLYELLINNEIVPDRHCPDDRFFVIDGEGRVHCFEYHGRIARPEDEEGER